MASSLAIAYGYVLGQLWGWLTFIVTMLAAAAVLVSTTGRIEVSDGRLRAGRAQIEPEYVGSVTVLGKAAAQQARGVNASAHAFYVMRSWLPEAVIVEITDPEDPHPYWYLSSKHAEELAEAIRTLS